MAVKLTEMKPDEFRDALERFGFAQQRFAEALGYSARAGQRWATGEGGIPGAVAVVLRLLLARPELVTVLDEIAPILTAQRKSKAGRPPTTRKTARSA